MMGVLERKRGAPAQVTPKPPAHGWSHRSADLRGILVPACFFVEACIVILSSACVAIAMFEAV